MMMMGQDDVGSDQTQIIKGKRTKRQRSSSTFVVAATTTTVTSTSSSAAGGGGRTGSDEYNSAVSSPVTTDCTEEEEDMAICLIMLARGAVPSPDLKNSRKNDKILHQKISPENSSFYVYECKTCNRTFPSFQALGGHRASHKKPRTSGEEKIRVPLMQPKSTATEEGQNSRFKVSGSALASQASNMSKANKVHECSICGSEFTSGQALGGHMRRHRAVTTAVSSTAATTAVSSTAAEVSRNITEEIDNLSRSMEQRKYLSLDLNLPAPEDDLRESKFQGIVFSATPALIDCHY